MIYFASPYSAPTADERHKRYIQVRDMTARLIREGFAIYSPIVHNHEIAINYDLPSDFDFWLNYDTKFLRCAEEFWIYAIPGWEESKGVSAERMMAYALRLTCRMVPAQSTQNFQKTIIITPEPPISLSL